jgi:hypothetical protein
MIDTDASYENINVDLESSLNQIIPSYCSVSCGCLDEMRTAAEETRIKRSVDSVPTTEELLVTCEH